MRSQGSPRDFSTDRRHRIGETRPNPWLKISAYMAAPAVEGLRP